MAIHFWYKIAPLCLRRLSTQSHHTAKISFFKLWVQLVSHNEAVCWHYYIKGWENLIQVQDKHAGEYIANEAKADALFVSCSLLIQ